MTNQEIEQCIRDIRVILGRLKVDCISCNKNDFFEADQALMRLRAITDKEQPQPTPPAVCRDRNGTELTVGLMLKNITTGDFEILLRGLDEDGQIWVEGHLGKHYDYPINFVLWQRAEPTPAPVWEPTAAIFVDKDCIAEEQRRINADGTD